MLIRIRSRTLADPGYPPGLSAPQPSESHLGTARPPRFQQRAGTSRPRRSSHSAPCQRRKSGIARHRFGEYDLSARSIYACGRMGKCHRAATVFARGRIAVPAGPSKRLGQHHPRAKDGGAHQSSLAVNASERSGIRCQQTAGANRARKLRPVMA